MTMTQKLATNALVHAFGESLGHAVGERLGENGAVVVVLLLVARGQLLRAEPGGHGESPDPVGETGLARRHEVGQGLGRLALSLVGLLAPRVQGPAALAGKKP